MCGMDYVVVQSLDGPDMCSKADSCVLGERVIEKMHTGNMKLDHAKRGSTTFPQMWAVVDVVSSSRQKKCEYARLDCLLCLNLSSTLR